MTPEELDAYLAWAVEAYAHDLEANGRADGEEAHRIARASFDDLLPHGVDSPGQVLLVGEDAGDGRRVGHVWFGPSDGDARRAWLWDIMVEERERGKGYGRALMEAFESEARSRGYARVGLNVFGENAVARSLYGSLGYREIARQLAKDL
jgi:GNAT superfamily N-acetyltransferase